MFGKLFSRHEEDPSDSPTASPQEQHPLPHPFNTAAGPPFSASNGPPSAKKSFTAGRQPSQQLQQQAEEQQDEEESEEEEEEENFVLSKPARKPALLQVKTAAEYSAETPPIPAAVSARQQAEQSPAKPWQRARQQQQQRQQMPAAMAKQQAPPPQQQQQHSGLEQLQQQLMLEAKAREVCGGRTAAYHCATSTCVAYQAPRLH